jgi:hypothetical protein
MSSILDIDLDYFNLMSNPEQSLERLLLWAGHPINIVVDRHNKAITYWKQHIRKVMLDAPSHILHVDEHHDMMDEAERIHIGNCIYHAMCIWPECRVHWLVEVPIDSPAMWLSDETWEMLESRFSMGNCIPRKWPKPDFVSVCTSPEFVNEPLLDNLLGVLARWQQDCS